MELNQAFNDALDMSHFFGMFPGTAELPHASFHFFRPADSILIQELHCLNPSFLLPGHTQYQAYVRTSHHWAAR